MEKEDSVIPARKPMSKKLRFEVFKRDCFCCQYCGAKPPTVVLEIDHIHPVSLGGKDDKDNLITACFDCNRGKSDRLLSSVPESLEARAEQMREKQEQIKAYERLLKTIKKQEERKIDLVQNVFQEMYSGFSFSTAFRESVRIFIKRIPIDQVEEAMRTACGRIESRNDAVKYFCGICWKIIKESNRG